MAILRSMVGVLLLPLLVLQSPQDSIRRHYEAAEAARTAGNLAEAESEYSAILAEGCERLGEILLAHEQPENAVAALESALEYRPSSTTLLIDLAIAYFDLEKYDRSVDVARKVLSSDPQNSGAHQMLGKSYFMLGELAKSVGELETAAKLSPNDLDVVYTLGIAYLRNRQNVEAKQLYDSLLRQSGDQPQLHVLVGRAYRQSGLLSDAAEEFKKAITLDEHCPRAHYYLGITYLLDQGQSQIAEALKEFSLELAQNPDDFLANYYLGVVYVFQRNWEPAIKVLQKAASIEPKNPDPYFQLSQAYQELDQHEKAIEVLRKAIEFNPDLGHNKGQVTTAHHRLAQSLIKVGQIEAGQKELQLAADLKTQAFKLEQQLSNGNPNAAVKTTPSDEANSDKVGLRKSIVDNMGGSKSGKAEELNSAATYYKKIVATAHNNLGLLRAQQNDFVVAASHFSRALEWNPQQEGVAFNLGLAYYKSQAYELAISPLEAELKVHPENRPAQVLLAMSYYLTEQYPRATELLSDLVGSGSANIDVEYALGSALIRQGKPAAAEALIEKLKSNESAAPQVHLLLAEIYFSRGETSKALAELGETNLPSTLKGVHYYAGMLYVKFNKPAEATQQFEAELAVTPKDIPSKYQLALIMLSRKNSDRAIALLGDIIRGNPNHYAARYLLGENFLKQRNFTSAIEHLEVAVKVRPDNAEAHYQLGQAYISAGRQVEGKKEIAVSDRLKGKASGVMKNN